MLLGIKYIIILKQYILIRVNTGNKKFQSLMDIEAIEQSLKSWYADDVLCICTGENGSGEVKCSANERDTCESAKEPPGKDVSVKKRDKRSGKILDSEYKFRTRRMKEKRAANRANPQVREIFVVWF